MIFGCQRGDFRASQRVFSLPAGKSDGAAAHAMLSREGVDTTA